MGQDNVSDRVAATWGGDWPPRLGRRVRVWAPLRWRGEVAVVVATEHRSRFSDIPVATPGKIRVMVQSDEGSGSPVLLLRRADVLPLSVRMKDLHPRMTSRGRSLRVRTSDAMSGAGPNGVG